MNIEELELSLRTEFEGQVRTVLAGIRTEVSEFQNRFQAEFEEHRAKLDRTISDLTSRIPESVAFDPAFAESVNEHLRLARDDGASVAAVAFGEAEKLRAESEAKAPVGGFDLMRDAIAEISSQSTQATILQALVDHASRFAARGAFFILKNEHFVGWKVFGVQTDEDGNGARDVLLQASADTVLAAAAGSMKRVSAPEGQYGDDSLFLDALHFGRPDERHAIPLTARGRGVAVLYVDADNGGTLNLEALETLVKVAGLTVELLAASNSAAAPQPAAEEAPAQTEAQDFGTPVVNEARSEESQNYSETVNTHESDGGQETRVDTDEAADEVEEVPTIAESVDWPAAAEEEEQLQESVVGSEAAEPEEEIVEYTGDVTYEVEYSSSESYEDSPSVAEAEVETFQSVANVEESEAVASEEPAENGFEFSSGAGYEASAPSTSEPAFAGPSAPVSEVPVAASPNGRAEAATVSEPIVEVSSAQPKKSRFSDRNVDLPIEVAEDERRLHNDARRFARLLVSEIKLYNEQQVAEGREAGDLYDRLKEAIDRSREMYDKRVQPAVASKYDYFHYEIVNNLAEGHDAKLGAAYPGATV